MEEFNFCPNSLVPERIAPAPQSGLSMNGWEFTSRPAVPFRPRYKLTLYGLRWHLDAESRFFDELTDYEHNARALENFYSEHQTWKEFLWVHPHIGSMVCKFAEKLDIPAGIPNSGGLIEKVEVNLIESNPRF